jgi:hypothetical protein
MDFTCQILAGLLPLARDPARAARNASAATSTQSAEERDGPSWQPLELAHPDRTPDVGDGAPFPSEQRETVLVEHGCPRGSQWVSLLAVQAMPPGQSAAVRQCRYSQRCPA